MLAFAAGFIAVPVFHQGMLTILGAIGLTGAGVFSMEATWPFGLPRIWSLAFWGGVWGLVLLAAHPYLPRGTNYWPSVAVFGALGPTLVAWLVVGPLKGQGPAEDLSLAVVITGLLVNAAWGLGTAALLAAFRQPEGSLKPKYR